MTAEKIHLSEDGEVSVLQLEDGKANTFEPRTLHSLERAIETVSSSSSGALLIKGRPGFFSAGLDLKVLPTATREERFETLVALGRAALALFNFPKPVIVALSGHALGAGAILALTADIRLAADGDFRFGLNEVSIGMIVPMVGVEIAKAACAPSTLAELLLHGRVFSPRELHARGLVESVHPPDALEKVAMERARGLSGLSRAAYAGTKERLRAEVVSRVRATLDSESAALVSMFDGRKG